MPDWILKTEKQPTRGNHEHQEAQEDWFQGPLPAQQRLRQSEVGGWGGLGGGAEFWQGGSSEGLRLSGLSAVHLGAPDRRIGWFIGNIGPPPLSRESGGGPL